MMHQTEEVDYPCPSCGEYNKPYMHNKKGVAYMLCKKCKIQYRTSASVSANFRRFCSRLGRAPNRSQTYYTSAEQKVRRFLINQGLMEGLDFFHNSRVGPFIDNNIKVYYWLDFVVPKFKLIIECSPSIWHKLWGRKVSDDKKTKVLTGMGWEVISLNERCLKQLNEVRRADKYPKQAEVLRLYDIFHCKERYSR